MPKKPSGGKSSNLFALDHDAIRSVLRDANAALLGRIERLVSAFDRMPAALDTDDLVDRARSYRQQIEAAAKELRQVRLGDGRPFRDADGAVKLFFSEPEQSLMRIERTVRQRLTDAALRARPPADEADAGDAALPPLGAAFDGSDVARVVPRPASPPLANAAAAAIRLRWEVEAVDRSEIDLEALRPFLTDASLLAACRKHLEENGPHALSGVAYREVAVD